MEFNPSKKNEDIKEVRDSENVEESIEYGSGGQGIVQAGVLQKMTWKDRRRGQEQAHCFEIKEELSFWQ